MKSHNEVFGLNVGGSNGVTYVTSDSDSVRRNAPGEIAILQAREGYRVYRYQKAEEAFALGQVAMISAVLDDADVDAAATTSEKTLTATGDFTAKEFNDGTFPSAYVTIDAAAATGQTRAILNNSANILSLDKAWDTALTTTSDYVTYDINYVSLMDTDDVSTDSCTPLGVAISAVSDENWAWFQVKGFNPLMRCVATSDAPVRGEQACPSATAGACKGANSTLAVIDVQHAFGYFLHGFATADTAGLGVASVLDCRYAC